MEEMQLVAKRNGDCWASWIYFDKVTFPVDKTWESKYGI
jgi:hypothetical protein